MIFQSIKNFMGPYPNETPVFSKLPTSYPRKVAPGPQEWAEKQSEEEREHAVPGMCEFK